MIEKSRICYSERYHVFQYLMTAPKEIKEMLGLQSVCYCSSFIVDVYQFNENRGVNIVNFEIKFSDYFR